ncbi:FtsX-like permease family protein [Yinghuangia sp. YIM S10712]|uniref:FtsX-like permease family protein n=1 Tax=Yinghuangia sp. YIM S10712 TaxID=3436930 RepID=UPI003F531017
MLISMLGACLGIVLGGLLAWGILGTLESEVPDLRLTVPWDNVAVFLGLGLAVGVGAAVWPARRAGRMDVLAAIRTE